MPKIYRGAEFQSEFLKAEIIARISRLGFTKKKICEGTVSGRHTSPFKGYSSEFSAFRPYTQGDDIRYLDWKVFARTERFYIKEFEQETNMRVCIVFDKSASMDFSSVSLSKINYAKMLASTLAYIIMKRGDSLGFAKVASSLEEYFPDSRSMKNLSRLLDVIAGIEPSGKTDIVSSLNSVGVRLKRKSLVILISDMLSDTAPMLRTIKNYIHRKHGVIVFQILDPLELTLPPGGRFMFIDKETSDKVAIDVKKAASVYRREFSGFLSGIENTLKNCGAGYFLFNTSFHPEDAIPAGLNKTGFSVV